ncbi:MAG: toxin HicA [Planctomycetes bacterium]|nr:toxin HicA [Planctomycetota bacterium]
MDIEGIVALMRESPSSVKFNQLCKVCDYYFGEPRQKATAHRIYKTPWRGDPRVNIQKGKNGIAKTYQVRQVIKAIDRLSIKGV